MRLYFAWSTVRQETRIPEGMLLSQRWTGELELDLLSLDGVQLHFRPLRDHFRLEIELPGKPLILDDSKISSLFAMRPERLKNFRSCDEFAVQFWPAIGVGCRRRVMA